VSLGGEGRLQLLDKGAVELIRERRIDLDDDSSDGLLVLVRDRVDVGALELEDESLWVDGRSGQFGQLRRRHDSLERSIVEGGENVVDSRARGGRRSADVGRGVGRKARRGGRIERNEDGSDEGERGDEVGRGGKVGDVGEEVKGCHDRDCSRWLLKGCKVGCWVIVERKEGRPPTQSRFRVMTPFEPLTVTAVRLAWCEAY
jgi:hypothetical protein